MIQNMLENNYCMRYVHNYSRIEGRMLNITSGESMDKKVRQSNLELLRIVSMLLVLMVHYIPTRIIPSPETIRVDFWNTLGQLELKSICFVCVNCFVLITGYFGIQWKTKSFSKLIYTIFFWGIVALVISKLITHALQSENLDYGSFWAETYTARWFIGAYLCLYIIAPIINAFINKSTAGELGKFIIIFYTFSTVFGWFLRSNNFNEGMSELSLAGLYLIGAYLKKSDNRFFSFKGTTDLMIFFGLSLLLTGINACTYMMGIDKSIHSYLNPIVIIQSIHLFLFFKKLNIGYMPWINVLAASTFSAYLFHDHQYIFPFYIHIGEWLNENSPIALLCMIGIIFAIFLFCALVDVIGNRIFEYIYKMCGRIPRSRVKI